MIKFFILCAFLFNPVYSSIKKSNQCAQIQCFNLKSAEQKSSCLVKRRECLEKRLEDQLLSWNAKGLTKSQKDILSAHFQKKILEKRSLVNQAKTDLAMLENQLEMIKKIQPKRGSK